MNFNESAKYLYSLGNEVLAMKLGLEATETLLHALGNTERNFLKVQIAGTNGKGSTCAFLDAICRAAKIETGLFTSPHLVSITERIKINGAEISETNFARHATLIRNLSEDLVKEKELETVPTFFEQMLAIAISAFAEAKIELAILETGLGGRFDSVTATKAEIAAIMPIDFDHQNILGNSLAEIAAEKAAIIRPDSRVVLAPQKAEAEKIILDKCRESNVEPIWATEKIQIERQSAFSVFTTLTANIVTENGNYTNVILGLPGRHQYTNAAVAVAVAETLRKKNFRISSEEISEGLSLAEHKGRLEFFQGILFDGAHNAAGAEALKNYLDEFIKQPVTLIFGAMRDKDLTEIAAAIFPKADCLIFTKPDNPRSMDASELMNFLPAGFDAKKVFQTGSVEKALGIGRKKSGDGNLLCVTGSLYLVGEARKILNNESEI